MIIEIDQSGKVEDTARKTVVGDSIGNYLSVSSKDKRVIQQVYRLSNQPRKFILHVFSLLCCLLISKTYSQQNIYLIDSEYPGKEIEIISLIVYFGQKVSIRIYPQQINIKRVGKSSLAHKTAHNAFSNKRAGRSLPREYLLRFLLPQKRTEQV